MYSYMHCQGVVCDHNVTGVYVRVHVCTCTCILCVLLSVRLAHTFNFRHHSRCSVWPHFRRELSTGVYSTHCFTSDSD